MKKVLDNISATETQAVETNPEQPKVHALQKSYTIVSDKHVDYNNLSAFEAVSMSMVFVLAVAVGVASSVNIF